MSDFKTPVQCQLSDCVHYLAGADHVVYCLHKEKGFYMKSRSCPLYRLDFKKKGGSPKDYLKIFNKKY